MLIRYFSYSRSSSPLFLILKQFTNLGVDYYREISSGFCSPTSCFLYFFQIFPSNFYILSNLVYQYDSGSSPWSFSLRFCVQHSLRLLSSASNVQTILICSFEVRLCSNSHLIHESSLRPRTFRKFYGKSIYNP